MNSKDILTVLLRLAALLAVTFLLGLVALYSPFVLSPNNADRTSMLCLAGSAVLTLMLLAVFAPWVASLLLPKASWSNVVTTDSQALELTRSALCVIAVYYLVSTLSGLPLLMVYFSSGKDGFDLPGGESLFQLAVFAPLTDLAIGMLLLVSANRLSLFICHRSSNRQQSSGPHS